MYEGYLASELFDARSKQAERDSVRHARLVEATRFNASPMKKLRKFAGTTLIRSGSALADVSVDDCLGRSAGVTRLAN